MLIMKCMYDPARNWLYVAVTIPTMNDGAYIDKESIYNIWISTYMAQTMVITYRQRIFDSFNRMEYWLQYPL